MGVFWGQFAARELAKNRAHGEQVFAWVGEGKLKPHVSTKETFANAARLLDLMGARKIMGKAVLVP